MRTAVTLLVCSLGVAGCEQSSSSTDGVEGTGSDGENPPEPIVGLPALDGPCTIDDPSPGRLMITTTDFATGAITIVNLADESVDLDVALGGTDAVPFFADDRAYVVHRFQHDYVDVLDPGDGWASLGEFPIVSPDVASANPQCVTAGADGLLYVTQLAVPAVAVLDPTRPTADAQIDSIDISAFADPDGNPDANHCFVCGSTLFVNVRRLDAEYAPVDFEQLVAIDVQTRRPYDIDPDRPGAQGFEWGGMFVKQIRIDPDAAGGHSVIAMSNGIERIDLATGTHAWAVPSTAFENADIAAEYQAQSFDVRGSTAILSAYDADYGQVQLYEVGLDGAEPSTPTAFASGYDSVERTLEIVDDRLWYGSTRAGEPGLWIFDLTQDPPAPVLDAPLSTGLPPYSLIGIP